MLPFRGSKILTPSDNVANNPVSCWVAFDHPSYSSDCLFAYPPACLPICLPLTFPLAFVISQTHLELYESVRPSSIWGLCGLLLVIHWKTSFSLFSFHIFLFSPSFCSYHLSYELFSFELRILSYPVSYDIVLFCSCAFFFCFLLGSPSSLTRATTPFYSSSPSLSTLPMPSLRLIKFLQPAE